MLIVKPISSWSLEEVATCLETCGIQVNAINLSKLNYILNLPQGTR